MHIYIYTHPYVMTIVLAIYSISYIYIYIHIHILIEDGVQDDIYRFAGNSCKGLTRKNQKLATWTQNASQLILLLLLFYTINYLSHTQPLYILTFLYTHYIYIYLDTHSSTLHECKLH